MKCLVPQLAWWLDTSALFSVDFQPKNEDGELRIASCGTDTHVRVWWLKLAGINAENKTDEKEAQIDIKLRADLTRHQRTVNIVRFSNSGEILASGDDEANIILWKLQPNSDAPTLFDGTENAENWQVFKILRGHIEDVCDLQWSPRDSYIVSGSIDSSAIVWDVSRGRSEYFLKEKKGFVQGVAYDPRGQLVATLSSNRNMYVYSTQTRKKVYVASKADIPVTESETITSRLFYDDTLKSFCRRPDFSPDGEFLVAPSGVIEQEGKVTNCIYVFHRSDLAKPIAYIPTGSKFTTSVRFARKFYKLRNAARENCLVNLPYRMIFAAATVDSILICDTESFTPFAVVGDAHYARLSDVSWSPDEQTLIVSSTDGYCSFVFFEKYELGEVYTEELPHLNAVDEVPRRKRTVKKKQVENAANGKKEGDDESENEQENDKVDIDDEDMDDSAKNSGGDSADDKSSTTSPLKQLAANTQSPPAVVDELKTVDINEKKKPARRATLTTLSSLRS